VYNLSIFLEDSARRYGDRDALVLGGTRLTYTQVNAMANQVANLLVELGVEPKSRLQVSALRTRLEWESSAPLGWPVVPLV
jgi:long-chain acyl-CoA synthetase